MKYYYLFSYHFESTTGTGFGRCELERERPIERIDDVLSIEKKIADMNRFKLVSAMSYQLMSKKVR